MKEIINKLTLESALKAIKQIKDQIHDNKTAHNTEDWLYLWFIECIAEGMYTKKEAVKIAKHIKTTQDLEFSRWCA